MSKNKMSNKVHIKADKYKKKGTKEAFATWEEAKKHMQEQGSVWLNGDTYFTILGFQHEATRHTLQFINTDGYWQDMDFNIGFLSKWWQECETASWAVEVSANKDKCEFNVEVSVPAITKETQNAVVGLLMSSRGYHETKMKDLQNQFAEYMMHKDAYEKYTNQIEEVQSLTVASEPTTGTIVNLC